MLKKVLVVGDIMLDTYYQGSVSRISPEAPVPVLKKEKEYSVLGGAANVARNMVAAGMDTTILGIVGLDEAGNRLKALLEKEHIDTSLLVETDQQTIEKTRFISADNFQQLLRCDIEDVTVLSEKIANGIIEKLKKTCDRFELVIISDYCKGVLTEYFTQKVIELANENNIRVLIDVKDKNYKKYKGAYLIKPNKKELKELTGHSVSTKEEVVDAALYLKKECSCQYILTTLGAEGMVLVGDDNVYNIAPAAKEVFDVTGAGDTTIAYLGAALLNGKSVIEAVRIANIAAGIQVSKKGTSAVYPWELEKQILHSRGTDDYKIINKSSIKNFRKNHMDEKIVFTNGCFDILHVGHVRYLQEAKNQGDILVVAINSDESIKRLKGEKRPINTERDRLEIIAALEFVDYVTIFSEDTPYELIKIIQPDVLAKGKDYKLEEVVGKDIVENRGGRVALIDFVDGKSTSTTIRKIEENAWMK